MAKRPVTGRRPRPLCYSGRPLTPGILANRLYYFYKTHQPGGGPGPLVDGVSPEHPLRSDRLKPYGPGVRAIFESHQGRVPRPLAAWVCSGDSAPTADEVLAKLVSRTTPEPAPSTVPE